jgi:hypothetical protein
MASRIIVAAALAATALAVMPATARSAPACAHRGAMVLANSQARVFRQGKVRTGETKGAPLYFSCSLRTGHVRRLNRRGEFGINPVTGSSIRLAGHYVGYVEDDVEALGAPPFAIVVDARHGHVIRDPEGSDQEDLDFDIVGLVLTARGTEAWIARDCVRSTTEPTTCAQPQTTEYRVTISDSTTGHSQLGERVVAHSTTIAPHSLALAANSHQIYWTDAGAAQSAPIH